ncbi:MAG: hypothetical protein PHQ23_03920 [Candidatus Wallbacteria bacterium]|nr:hypothetical protein [Candidatus Wallbacteria bacterium]
MLKNRREMELFLGSLNHCGLWEAACEDPDQKDRFVEGLLFHDFGRSAVIYVNGENNIGSESWLNHTGAGSLLLFNGNSAGRILFVIDLFLKNSLAGLVIVDSLMALDCGEGEQRLHFLRRIDALCREYNGVCLFFNYMRDDQESFFSYQLAGLFSVRIKIVSKSRNMLFLETMKNSGRGRYPEISI